MHALETLSFRQLVRNNPHHQHGELLTIASLCGCVVLALLAITEAGVISWVTPFIDFIARY